MTRPRGEHSLLAESDGSCLNMSRTAIDGRVTVVYTRSVSSRSTAVALTSAWLPLPCLCANVRRLARLSTRLYDEALRKHDIEVGQFTLLATLLHLPMATQGQLAAALGMEPSSLTRNLAQLEKRGWVDKDSGADRRSRRVRITPDGRKRFNRAVGSWRAVQQQMSACLGGERMQQLGQLVDEASSALQPRPSPVRRRPVGARRT